MLGWLLNTRIGRLVGAALAGIGILLGAFLMGKREGGQRARERAREADRDNAQDIEERVDEALRKHDGDTRPVDDRLRERGRLRD